MSSPPLSPERCILRVSEDPFRKSLEVEAEPWKALSSYVSSEVLADPALRVYRNGRLVPREDLDTTVANLGDRIAFVRAPAGTEFAVFLVLTIVLAAASYAIQASSRPRSPTLSEDLESSGVYGFAGLQNSIRPGSRIPRVYGTHRVGGIIIGQFQRAARDTATSPADPLSGELHTLIALGTGPVYSIDEVRVNRNDSSLFSGIEIETRLGSIHQAPIPGFDDVVSPATHDAAISHVDGPLTFSTQGEVDLFEVSFRFAGGLFRTEPGGQYRTRTVEILVEEKLPGLEWTTVGKKVVSQKTASPFDAFFVSPRGPRTARDIRITRLTPDDSSATGYSTFTVHEINDVLATTLTYPGVALLGVRQLPTNQLSGRPPSYDALVKGSIVRVFSDPLAYEMTWSDNPAWVILDILTDPDEGLGAWISDEDILMESFLEFAADCEEKGFKVNIVLDGSLNAIEAIRQVCTASRAFFFFRGNKWGVRMEKPRSESLGFSMGRVGKDSFTWSRRTRAEKANYFEAQFWNEDLDFEQDTYPLEDPLLSESDERVDAQVNLLGVTSRKQADSILRHFILKNRLSQRMISCDVGPEAIGLELGDVFKFAHNVPGWGLSGKLVAVEGDGTRLKLDRDVVVESGKEYELTVFHKGGEKIDVLQVLSLPGTHRWVSTSGYSVAIPEEGEDFSFGEVSKSSLKFIAVGITESEVAYRQTVIGEQYDEDAYGEDLSALPEASISRIPSPDLIPPDVKDLRLVERTVYAEDGTISIAIDCHFVLPAWPGVRAQVFWRESGDPIWEAVGSPVSVGYFPITENVRSPGGEYEVSVVSVSQTGVRKSPDRGAIARISTTGTTRRPGKVVSFRVNRTSEGLLFQWDALDPDLYFDLDFYEVRQGTVWETAAVIGRTKDTSLATSSFVKGTHTFLLKAFNTAGKDSAEPAVVIFQVDGRIGENIIFERIEESATPGPAWPGTLEGFTISSGKLVLSTTSQSGQGKLFETAKSFRSGLIPGGFGSGFRVQGSYTTPIFQVTLTDAVRALVSYELTQSQIDASLYWTAPGVADQSWQSTFARSRAWAVAPEGTIRTRVEMRFSAGTTAESDFGPWQVRPANVEVSLKYAQVRIIVEILDPVYIVEISGFRFIADVPDVVDSGEVETSNAGLVSVNFNKQYNDPPYITALVIGGSLGDEIVNTAPTKTGFTVGVKNGGSFVTRTLHWTAVGF